MRLWATEDDVRDAGNELIIVSGERGTSNVDILLINIYIRIQIKSKNKSKNKIKNKNKNCYN